MKGYWIGVVVALLALSACAVGDIYYVDGDSPAGTPDGTSWATAYQSLGELLDHVQTAGGTVRIAQGTYDEYGLYVGEDLEIVGGYAGYGEADPDAWDPETYVTTIDGGGNQILIAEEFENLTISGITFMDARQGNDAADGGALGLSYIDNVVLSDLVFDNCQVPCHGGAIWAYTCGLDVSDCDFTDCAAYLGGAIAMDYCTPVSFEDCYFGTNVAVMGGAIQATNSDITMDGCELNYNDTSGGGGGVKSRAPSNAGGCMVIENVNLDMTDCELLANTAGERGGGIYAHTSYLTLTDCYLESNVASGGDGGAIYAEQSYVTSVQSTYISNSSVSNGGAIAVEGYMDVAAGPSKRGDIEFSYFLANYFTDNYAGGGGGGLYFSYQAGSVFASNLFAWNDAVWFGGAIAYVDAQSVVTNDSFFANTAGDLGGAISITGPGTRSIATAAQGYDLEAFNCIFAWNNAAPEEQRVSRRDGELGGAVFCGEGETALVDTTCVWENTPDDFTETVVTANLLNADPMVDEEDGDLMLGSPCIDAGRNDATALPEIDIDGFARIVGDYVDMGADEFGNEEDIRNMAVTGVEWTPDPLQSRVATLLRVTVENQGTVVEEAARVKVLVDGVQIGDTVELALGPGESETVEFPWDANAIGRVTIQGRTEPTVGPDVDRSNNSMTLTPVVHGHDVAVTRLESFPENPTPGQQAKLYVYVRNVGTDPETAVRIKALINGVQVDGTYTTALAVGEQVRAVFYWTPTEDGTYTFEGRAEPTVGPDFNRADNSMRKKVAAWQRDVAIMDFFLRPGLPHVGQAARMGIVIENKTDFRESGALVRFYAGGVMIGSRRVELMPHQRKTVEVPWTFATAGGIFVEGRVEPTSGIDKNRSDNYRRSYLVVQP